YNMGIVFDVRREWDRAMELFRESAGVKERLGDLDGLTYNLDNMGMVSSRQGRYDQAEAYFLRAADIRRTLGDERGYGIVLNNIGEMYLLKGDHNRALPFFERALEIARATSFADFEQYIHGKVSEVFEARGDHRAALTWYRSGTALRDSLFNESRNRQLTELQTRYETEKKEQTIALQEARIQAQQADIQRNYLLIGALVLLTGLIAIAYYLRKAREQLRIRQAEMNASIASQERERRRIAQDLHDGLGQLITTARMYVQPDRAGTSADSEDAGAAATSFDRTTSGSGHDRPARSSRTDGESGSGVSDEMLREMHREVRNIAFNLMPATLVRKGLAEAVDELARRTAESGSVSIHVQSHGFEGRCPEYWEIATYRIVQEWLSNVFRHASAGRIDIQITGHQDEIIVMIEDDGVGLNVDDLRTGSGSGWSNIQSRARQIDGVIHIDSDPRAGGTTFILRTPVPADIPVAEAESQRA
ncbi:MAG: tetratricopeptide repeat protein, partial [Rhodothermales bacterium]|nr:tetratricopeptide repeat protein [Rhodothermales bacterium]